MALTTADLIPHGLYFDPKLAGITLDRCDHSIPGCHTCLAARVLAPTPPAAAQ